MINSSVTNFISPPYFHNIEKNEDQNLKIKFIIFIIASFLAMGAINIHKINIYDIREKYDKEAETQLIKQRLSFITGNENDLIEDRYFIDITKYDDKGSYVQISANKRRYNKIMKEK